MFNPLVQSLKEAMHIAFGQRYLTRYKHILTGANSWILKLNIVLLLNQVDDFINELDWYCGSIK